jgi:hypothetical protein
MISKAKEKLNSEISKSKDPYVKVVGQFLLQHLEANQGAAEKILQEDKTISKSLDAMKEAAKKKAVGGCAMLTDQEGFEIVLKYFGIDGQVAPAVMDAVPNIKIIQKQAIKESRLKSDVDFDVSLDDFI